MINVSDAFKQKLQDGEKVWQEVEITFPDGTVKTVKDEIMGENCTYSDCAESSSFPIGATICKSMTLELDNSSDQWKDYYFYMAKVHAYLKMQIDSETVEAIDKGTYTITTPEQYGELLSFTALDDMYKANTTYTSNLVLPQSIENLVRDACETLGILSGVSMTHGTMIVTEIPESMTFRQFFGWAAMMDCANARIDNSGYLRFVKWNFADMQEDYGAKVNTDGFVEFTGGSAIDGTNFVTPTHGNWTVDTDGYLVLLESIPANVEQLKDFVNFPTVSSDDIVITGIKLKNKNSVSMQGTTGYVLEMENDLVSDDDIWTVAAQIGDALIGIKFRSMSGDLAYNPLIEFGDMAYTYDRKWNRYITPLTDVSCAVNGITTVKTQAEDPIRGQSKFQSEAAKALVEARRLVNNERSAREEAIRILSDKMAKSSGLYKTEEVLEDGSTIYYMHNKPKLEESDIIWRLTANAISVSSDGGKTYPYGFAVTGEMIAKMLYADGIDATYINAGTFTVKDSKGNIIFQADMTTGSVYISGSVQIGGAATLDDIKQTADDAAKKANEASEAAAAAKNMTLILSNEFQAIAADSDGNITTFPECKTTATVMYGSTDVTAECTFVVTKSDNVAGSWDDSTRTYTVTGLTADDGWIDIKATYIKALSVTKRFSLAKQKAGSQGTDGESGRSYSLESSCSIIKQKENGELEPTYINFEAFYFDGTSAERKDYTGIYTIEESSDGGATWKEVYRSGTNEHSVKHHMYLGIRAQCYREHVLKRGVLAGSDGSGGMIAFGVPKTVTDVRCSFYAYGSYSTDAMPESKKIASKTISVISEKVKSLSQSDIVEILSDNGKFNGLYYIGGKLYISLSALLGGEMTLGGVNNGNGVMRIRDSNNRLNMEISNGGQILYDKNELVSAVLQQDKIFFFDNSVSITNSRQDIAGICLSNKGLIKFDGHIYKDSNNNIYFESSFVSVDGQSEELTPLYYDSKSDGLIGNFVKIATGSMSTGTLNVGGASFSYRNEILTINKAISLLKRLSVGGALSVGGDSEIKGDETIKNNLYVEGNATITDDLSTTGDVFLKSIPVASGGTYLNWQVSGQVTRRSSSSRRYKNIGAPISEQDIADWYQIQPVWASYKDGYLTEGDERGGTEFPMFVAEDVEEHMPLAVDHLPDGRVETWNERVMIPMMFAMLKSQKDKIDKMQATIDRLIEKIGE